MGEDDERGIRYYWEKYLPCRLHRKNVVLILLTIFCFALVTWTVVATISDPNAAAKAAKPMIHWVLDDSQSLDRFNLSTQSARKNNLMRQEIRKARKKGFRGPVQTVLRDMVKPENRSHPMCKCLCEADTSEADLIASLQAEAARKAEEGVTGREVDALMGAAADVLAGGGDYGGDEEDDEYEYGEEGADEMEDVFEKK